jgi:hypothetical protein
MAFDKTLEKKKRLNRVRRRYIVTVDVVFLANLERSRMYSNSKALVFLARPGLDRGY